MTNNPISLLLLLLILAACAPTQKAPDGRESPARRAAEVNVQLAVGYLRRGDYEIALEKLTRAVEHDPSYPTAQTMLGVLYETIDEPDKAGSHYRKAVRLDPESGEVNNNYGQYLCREGKYAEAEAHFLTATDDPFYQTPAVAWGNAGTCVLRAGELDKAERYLRQSLEFDANYADALLPMATLSYRKGSYLQARAFLQRYESVGEAGPDSLLLGYRIETALGDRRSAERYADDLFGRFPDTAQARTLRNEV